MNEAQNIRDEYDVQMDVVEKEVDRAIAAGDAQALRALEGRLINLEKQRDREVEYLDAGPLDKTANNVGRGLVRGLAGIADIARIGYNIPAPEAAEIETSPTEVIDKFQDRYSPVPNPTLVEKGLQYTGEGASFLLPAAGATKLLAQPGRASGAINRAAAAPFTARGGVSELAAGFGSAAGENYAEAKFGPEYGALGALFGGIAPSAARAGGNKALQAGLADENSNEVFHAARDAGVRPTAGLVGNSTAARGENVLGLVPFVGSRVDRRQGQQVQQLEGALQRTSDDLHGGQQTLQDPSAIGVRVQEIAQNAEQALRHSLDELELQQYDQLGGRTAPINVQDLIENVQHRMKSLSAEGQQLLKQRVKSLGKIKNTPIDQQLHAQLSIQLDNLNRRLPAMQQAVQDAGPNVGAARAQLLMTENLIDQKMQELNRNLGVSAEQLEDWRRRLGEQTAKGPGVDAGLRKQVYGDVRDTQRAQVSGLGGDPAEFDALTKSKETIQTEDLPLVTGLQKAGSGDAFNAAFVRGIKNPELLDRLKRNVSPEDWDALAGDYLISMGQPSSATQLASRLTTDSFASINFLKNWKVPRQMPQGAKDALFSPQTQNKLDALATVAEALSRRGTAANPSGTTATALTALGIKGLLDNTVKTAGGIAAGLAGSNAILSEKLAEIVAGEAPTFAQRLRERGATRAGVAATGTDERKEDPDFNRFAP